MLFYSTRRLVAVQDKKKFPARCVEVVSGDCIIVKAEGDDEEKRLRKNFYDSAEIVSKLILHQMNSDGS